ncbi:MAG: glycosyltransferase family 4 protein [candidate division Zixibacteria bacterium]|nr:glycosyltransferase family 4 protein [candidate division Zixibacteria bacterium]
MKILLANKYFHPAGGPETLLFDSMEKLQSLGHTVIPFSMQHPKNLKSEYEEYFVSNVDYNNHSRNPWDMAKSTFRIIFNLEAKKKMEQLIKDTKPDIAHLHNIYHQLSPSILLPLKKYNIPVVMSLHDFKLVCPNYTFLRDGKVCEECEGKHFYKAIKYKCVKDSYAKSAISALEMYVHKLNQTYIKTVDCFIALSRFTQKKLIQYGLPQEKIVYLPNYVNVSTYKTNSTKKRYILFLGTLSDKNGIFTLVKAMRNLSPIKLKIAGAGEQEKLIRDYIRENKMKNIELAGFLSREKLKETIANCDFLVFPNNCYHNCPMSILESFAYGKPVVGSNLGSVPELVEDGRTGLLFEPRDEKELAEKIKYLYENPQMVEKMGRNARRKVEGNFSAEKYYPKLLQIYEELIQKKKVRVHPHPVVETKIIKNKEGVNYVQEY